MKKIILFGFIVLALASCRQKNEPDSPEPAPTPPPVEDPAPSKTPGPRT
ncbi:membrane lipoprotein lipid attachment site-containing protein [Flavobacterium cyanobacteriorum]|nr:membrane lipoprotein lipid attachment site-containing protein [Flavobacterium cyanobacteriorum]